MWHKAAQVPLDEVLLRRAKQAIRNEGRHRLSREGIYRLRKMLESSCGTAPTRLMNYHVTFCMLFLR